ncbi:hypothetical protein DSBG_3015 [Desulfosporosinus sp. BG]|nr:hypothetical protein DSBG_3015 [Desulfosporosinus sp. BG]
MLQLVWEMSSSSIQGLARYVEKQLQAQENERLEAIAMRTC